MNEWSLIKNELIDRLTFSISSLEGADYLAKNYLKFKNPACSTLYTIMNRQDYLQNIFCVLNAPDQKLIKISGFFGTGKTELVKTVLAALEENILNHYYQFSAISNLDDLVLSLYSYLHKELSKEPEYQRYKKKLSVKSIDKRLITYLKNLKRPFVIVFDGFENLIDSDDSTVKDGEILSFINYLLTLRTVKLIIAGRRIPNESFNVSEEYITKMKLIGLEEMESNKILTVHKIEGGSQLFYQAFEATRGYPQNLMLFVKSVDILKLTPFEIIKDYSIRKESFEEYISKKMYSALKVSQKRIMWFFTLIRHPIALDTLHKINIASNLDETLDFLVTNGMLSENNNSYYLKDLFRDYIYNNIPSNERIKVHKFLHGMYTSQISCNFADRILHISRKSLKSEMYYHYTCVEKLKNGASNIDQSKIFSNETSLAVSYLASKYDNILPPGLSEAIVVDEKDIQTETKKEADEKPVTKINEEDKIEGQVEVATSDSETEINLELTEEEKAILQDQEEDPEGEPQKIDEINNVEETHNPDDIDMEEDAAEIAVSSEQEPEIKKQKPHDDRRREYISKAITSKKEGKLELAIEYYKKALEIAELSYDTTNIARVSKSIANILHVLKKYDEALEYLNKSLNLFTGINDISNANIITLKIANMYMENYKHKEALDCYNKILEQPPEAIQDKLYLEILIGIGDIYDYRSQFNSALKYYFSALEKAELIQDTGNISKLYFRIALIYDDHDDFDSALVYYQKNIQIADTAVNPYLSSSYANLASLYEDMDDTNNAIINYTKSLEIDKSLNNYKDQYKTLSRLGNIYMELDVHNKALAYFESEIEAAKMAKDPYALAMSYIDIGDFHIYKKDYEKALNAYIIARRNIGKTVSTDTKEKIDRRFKEIASEMGERKFNILVENVKRKYGAA